MQYIIVIFTIYHYLCVVHALKLIHDWLKNLAIKMLIFFRNITIFTFSPPEQSSCLKNRWVDRQRPITEDQFCVNKRIWFSNSPIFFEKTSKVSKYFHIWKIQLRKVEYHKALSLFLFHNSVLTNDIWSSANWTFLLCSRN